MEVVDKQNINCINIDKLKKARLLPRYIDGMDSYCEITAEQKLKVPFSKNYNTYKEYSDDIDRAADIGEAGEEIPDEIIDKLTDTANELNIGW